MMLFLHCMKKFEYLSSAVKDGLMFTSHEVKFLFSQDDTELIKYQNEIMKFINLRLGELGTSFESLPDDRQKIIMMGIGSITGKIPMICFTEVPEGKEIKLHGQMFGYYGVLVRKEFIDKYNGDKVIYVGDNKSVGKLLARIIAIAKSMSLHRKNSMILFNSDVDKYILSFFGFIENSINFREQEWRIVGNHGFFGGGNDAGTRISIDLSDIEKIFVKEEKEIESIQQLIAEKAKREEYNGKLPIVELFPK